MWELSFSLTESVEYALEDDIMGNIFVNYFNIVPMIDVV